MLAALHSQGVDAHAFDPAEQDLSALRQQGFARAFIALHGRHGEDGTVQGALELMGIPYTGSGVMASAIAMDKVMTKRVWVAEGLPTPRWVWLAPEQQTRETVMAVPDTLNLPLIVKPPREGSSIGITKVAGYSQMQDAVQLAAQYDADVLCEEFIDGIELTCPVLGRGAQARALPVVRIDAPEGRYDFQNKYYTDVYKRQAPAQRQRRAGHGRLCLLSGWTDGQPAQQAADAGQRRRSHAAEQSVAAAAGRPRGLRVCR